jgi:hypothetical protein
MDPRTVSAGHGWTWIVQGYALFRRSPANWLALVLMLLAASKLLTIVPVLGVVFILLMPIFVAGLMEGCRALERGEPLQLMHLACGFRRNAADLVTLGGLSLVGNLVIMMIVIGMAGDSISALNAAFAGAAPQAITPELRAAWLVVARALLTGTLVSLPLLLALWYAPLLVYFHDARPLAAMKSSLYACARNAPAMLVYGLVVFAGIFLAMPFARALHQYDLALWLLAPVLVPSLYASYRDIYRVASTPEPDAEPSA